MKASVESDVDGRVLGVHDDGQPGPILFVCGALHGNEPAGVRAFERVLEQLSSGTAKIRGRVVGLTGNMAALARRRRALGSDLNRGWSDATVARSLTAPQSAEDRERAGVIEVLARYLPDGERAIFLDLHTTSGDGPAFVCMSDVVRNRAAAFALGVPVILGLEEILDGTLVGWLTERGHIAIAVEGGQHDIGETVDRHVAAIWIAMAAEGLIAEENVPGDLDRHREVLNAAADEVPRVLEIRHRHGLPDGGPRFVMDPGFANFTPLTKGQRVARDGNAAIQAPFGGYMMLPRYQPEGDDGYFIVTPVSQFWLWLSKHLRRRRIDGLLRRLPGVTADGAGGLLVVGDSMGLARRLLHLFGYRRRSTDEAGRDLYGRRRRGSLPPLPFSS